MKITPLELRKPDFKHCMRGYRPDEVDAMLSSAADALEELIRENEPRVKTIEKEESNPGTPEDREGAEKKHKERVEKLRQMSIKLKSPGGLNELENEPAFRRKNVELSEEKPSEESQVSRYTLTDEEDEAKLKDNSFLHDNVD